MTISKLPAWIPCNLDAMSGSKRKQSMSLLFLKCALGLFILSFPGFLIASDGAVHSAEGMPKAANNPQAVFLITPTLLLQVEATTPAAPGRPGVSDAVKCMQAQKSVRTFNNFSFLLALVVSFLFYTLWLFVGPRLGPPMVKWAISPLLASLIIATIMAYYAQVQSVESCGMPDVFPVDIFARNFLFNWAICGGIFLVWCLIRFFSLRKRIGSSLA
jgi:hypothetical protein